ncbi:MAG: Nramp family divalent metal transporter [Pirellulaceae bacterium]|nr:Nramp family divalent metal transporter [Pirellulaceae bacterium]
MTDAAPSSGKKPAQFVPPHPGSQQMPRWDAGELIDAPRFQWRNVLALIGPGLVMGAAAIGGGEWLAGPQVTARYGPSLLWVAAISILFQVLYNIEISRYTLYTGEPIFTGKFRVPPGPMLWVVVYLLLDWGAFAPYLAMGAASPLIAIFKGEIPKPNDPNNALLVKIIASAIFGCCAVPLIFGGKVYNSLKVIMSFKLVTVIGFLLFLTIFYSYSSTWWEIVSGFTKIGTVPVIRAEDTNGNGVLDPGEDFDGDGNLDVVEFEKDEKGKVINAKDIDADGIFDGANVDNIFTSLINKGTLPKMDWSLMAMIAGLAAIAGNGGLTNTPISNFTRDQGWGMGHHVGAIPSMIGGQGITLSHVGCVFDVTPESLPRWRRWYNHIVRDQTLAWMLACFIGVGLPSVLSVGFMKRGTECDDYNTASLTAGGVEQRVANPPSDVLASQLGLSSLISGKAAGRFFWGCTLFCGFLVLATSMASTIDGFIRRWLDAFWTAIPALRKVDISQIGKVYFCLLVGYLIIGFSIIWSPISPAGVFKIATTGYNFALAISAWHTLVVNTTLLPKELRPNWFIRIGLVFGGLFFVCLGIMSVLKMSGMIK